MGKAKRSIAALFMLVLVLMSMMLSPSAVSAASTMTIVSDTNTMVTAGNVPAATYPHNAVLAWQPFNPANDYWDNNLTGHVFSNSANWIWESERVQHPVAGDIVEFKREFNIPGSPTAGTIYITCDNGYDLRINDQLIGTAQLGTGWKTSNLTESYVNTSGWQSVETWDVTGVLVSGENVIEISTANEYMGQLDGQSDGTIDSNPAGLIFEIEISYEEVYEESGGIGDFVWNDNNRNGIQDTGEVGIPSMRVNLLDSTDSLIVSTTTDSSGSYGFTGLTPGNYRIEFDLFTAPAGYIFTVMNAGSDLSKDSNADTTGKTVIITLAEGENNMTIDAGLYNSTTTPPTTPVEVGGEVYPNNSVALLATAILTIALLSGAGVIIRYRLTQK